VTSGIVSATIQPASTQGITFKERRVTFNELIRLLETNGFYLVKQKGSVRHYGKVGWPRLIRVDYHGNRQVPTGTCHAILKAAGITKL
jgi:predicted RNA binding protein YcfA (HicA-like mRNA interferase family)